jgi:hypothetical protein
VNIDPAQMKVFSMPEQISNSKTFTMIMDIELGALGEQEQKLDLLSFIKEAPPGDEENKSEEIVLLEVFNGRLILGGLNEMVTTLGAERHRLVLALGEDELTFYCDALECKEIAKNDQFYHSFKKLKHDSFGIFHKADAALGVQLISLQCRDYCITAKEALAFGCPRIPFPKD